MRHLGMQCKNIMGQDIFSNHHTTPGLINETHLLTRVLSFEVANEADVFLHPLEGSQLHGIIDHLHWVLQHLGGSVTGITVSYTNFCLSSSHKHVISVGKCKYSVAGQKP